MRRRLRFAFRALVSLVALTSGAPAALAQWDHVFDGVELTVPVQIDGPQWNNTLVKNCKIHDTGGYGLWLRNVDNVTIRNCEIYNVAGSGIRLSSTGSTSNVTLEGNSIHDAQENGIAAAQRSADGVDHRNLRILNNTIRNTGLCCSEGLQHGIYVQAQDFLIEGNTVLHSRDGNGISVRSSGVVRNNVVGYTGKSGIAYYADHLRGPSDKLVVENNIAYHNGYYGSHGRAAIHLLAIPYAGFAVRSYELRFNTAVSMRGDRYALETDGDYAGDSYDVQVYGNLLVNAISGSAVMSGPVTRDTSNYKTGSLASFVSAAEPHDFHLQDDHPARGFASGESSFPALDIDGEQRTPDSLDAGADQGAALAPICTLELLTPNGGEQLEPTDTLRVSWTGEPALGSQVGLSLYHGDSEISRVVPIDNDGVYETDLSQATGLPVGDGYRVELFSSDDPEGCSDASDANFSIGTEAPPPIPEEQCSLEITSPNGGESYRRYRRFTIRWSGEASGSRVALELLRDGSLYRTISSSTSDDGSYRYRSRYRSSRFQIRISDPEDPSCSDVSDAYFEVR